jgi:hypothetical protein
MKKKLLLTILFLNFLTQNVKCTNWLKNSNSKKNSLAFTALGSCVLYYVIKTTHRDEDLTKFKKYLTGMGITCLFIGVDVSFISK